MGMSEKDFTKQREKWERWLQERQAAGTADEPLLVLVDDELGQLNTRYYTARMYGIPSRDVIIFESAAEAIEFIKFAKDKKLNLSGVITDFDNGHLSPENGNKVLEETLEFEDLTLRYLISSDPRDFSEKILFFNQAAADKVQFFEKTQDDEVERFFRTAAKKYNDVAKDQEEFIPILKQHLDIFSYYERLFQETFAPYQNDVVAGESKPLKEKYKLSLESISEGKKTVNELIMLVALLKKHEAESNKSLRNPDGQSPTEPLIIRTLCAFCLNQMQQLQKILNDNLMGEFGDRFEGVRVAATEDYKLRSDFTGDPGAKASQIVHTLNNVSYGIRENVKQLVKKLTEFSAEAEKKIAEQKPRTWTQFVYEVATMPIFTTHQFTHETLMDLLQKSEETTAAITFGYIPYDHPARPKNTPGTEAPKRKELVLITKENAHLADEHQTDTLERVTLRDFCDLVKKDQRITKAGGTSSIAELMVAAAKAVIKNKNIF